MVDYEKIARAAKQAHDDAIAAARKADAERVAAVAAGANAKHQAITNVLVPNLDAAKAALNANNMDLTYELLGSMAARTGANFTVGSNGRWLAMAFNLIVYPDAFTLTRYMTKGGALVPAQGHKAVHANKEFGLDDDLPLDSESVGKMVAGALAWLNGKPPGR